MPAGSGAQHAAGQMCRPQPHGDTVAARRASLILQLQPHHLLESFDAVLILEFMDCARYRTYDVHRTAATM